MSAIDSEKSLVQMLYFMVLNCKRCVLSHQLHNFVLLFGGEAVSKHILKSWHSYYCQNPLLPHKRSSWMTNRQQRASIDFGVCVMWANMYQENGIDNTLNMIWLWHVHQHAQITCELSRCKVKTNKPLYTNRQLRKHAFDRNVRNVHQFISYYWNKCRRFSANIVLLFLWNVIQLNLTEWRIQ